MKTIIHMQRILMIAIMFSSLAIFSQSPEEAFEHEVLWSAYTGHAGMESVQDIYVDHVGNHYIVGYAPSNAPESWNFLNEYHGGSYDAFVTKSNMDGDVLWSLWLGGEAGDFASSVTCGSSGLIVIAGFTSSENITEAIENGSIYHGGANDGVMFTISIDGQILGASYFGGSGSEYPTSVVCDQNDGVIVVGKSSSMVIDGYSVLQPISGGGMNDGLIIKMDMLGNVQWYSFIGGTGSDHLNDVAISTDGRVVFCGDGSYIDALFSVRPNDDVETTYGFVGAINNDGEIDWVSYLNGNGAEMFNGIDIDEKTGNILAIGSYDGTVINVCGISLTRPEFDQDVVATCLNSEGIPLWVRQISGSGHEVATDIQMDLFSNVYISGSTSSQDLAVVDAFQENLGGGYDAMVAKLTAEGELIWMSFMGGTTDEYGGRFGTDRFGKVTLCGSAIGSGLTPLKEDRPYQAQQDGFVSRISDCENPVVTLFALEDTVFCDGNELMMSACGAENYMWMNGDTTMMSDADTTMMAYVIGHNFVGCYGMSLYQSIESLEVPVIEIFTDGPTVFCGEQEVELYAIGPDTIIWNNEMMGDMIVIDTAGVYSASGRGENGCVGSSDPLEIEFIELPHVDMAITDDTVCISDAPVPMISIPNDGFYVGPGTEVPGYFNPATAGGGTHTITYQWLDENGCTGTSQEVTVHVMFHPTVLFVAADTLCLSDPAIELSGTPAGGVFEGDGVVGNIFTPSESGTGPQNIFYSYVDENGCTNVANSVIYVDACTFTAENEIVTNDFKVYPIPATDVLNIETGLQEYVEIRLFSADGKLVLDQSFFNKTQLNCTTLGQGLYHLECVNGVNISSIPILIQR